MDGNSIIHVLENGLRIVYTQRKSNVAYCGIAVNAGSRDEAELHGLAHFVEHTIFKGTRRRRAWHILNRMELVGGELNAYTTKEETLVYSVFPAGNMERAVELIADLVQNSIFPEKELEKERKVVLEEIHSYRDTPSESIYDDFEDLVFAGHPLGHNILGSEKSLSRIGQTECRRYLTELYVPANMVLFAVGRISPERMIKLAERYFAVMHHKLERPQRIPACIASPFYETRNIRSHQAHCIIGAPTFGMHDSRKYALLLLNNMLGGPGMNSALNVAIRERRGYAYTVEAATTLFTDCGLFTVYFGCDARQIEKCLRLVDNEIRRLASDSLKQHTLNAAKKQYIGQLLVGSESVEGFALSTGKNVLYFGKAGSVKETTERINAIAIDEIRDIAAGIADNLSTLIYL